MELIERDYALRLLQADLALVSAGKGRTSLVFGEAGIGKTSLARQFASGRPDVRQLWGGCEALFSPRPLGPLYDMANSLGSDLSSMVGREGMRPELFSALLAHVSTGTTATLVVLEDLHWADAATLDLVKFLARRIQNAPVMLLLTYRDDELGDRHPLRTVLGDLPAESVTRLHLLPLSEAGVAELAERSNNASGDLFARTGGNPFFLTEALRTDGLPLTVRDAVLARASRQGEAVRALLDLVAVVPGRIELDAVRTILGGEDESIAAALASGLVTADQRSLAFRHELARVAIEQTLPVPRAAALHTRMLIYLEQAREILPTARLVHHAAGAGDTAAVLKYAPKAAIEAASHGAHREAATLYGTALTHAALLEPPVHAALMEHRAYQCYLTDQIDEAILAMCGALKMRKVLKEVEAEGRCLRWLSRLHWYRGHNREADSHADQAVAMLQRVPSSREFALAISNRSQLHMLAGNKESAISWGIRAVELATQIGDLEIVAHALNNVGSARYQRGDAEGRAELERSLALALEHGFGEHVARAYTNLATIAVVLRDYATARMRMQEAAIPFPTHGRSPRVSNPCQARCQFARRGR